MEKLIFNVVLTILLTSGVLFFSSCNSSSKGENEENKIEEAQEGVEDAVDDADEWTTFKTDAYDRIENNNELIAKHREKMKTAGKTMDKMHQQRIEELEKKNAELRGKIDAYTKDDSNWESFKAEFKHDMDELEKSLEDLTDDNVK